MAHSEANAKYCGTNHFIQQKAPTDFRGAKITLKLRGQNYDARGSKLVLLVQGALPGMDPSLAGVGQTLNFAYTGEPFAIGEDWSEVLLLA